MNPFLTHLVYAPADNGEQVGAPFIIATAATDRTRRGATRRSRSTRPITLQKVSRSTGRYTESVMNGRRRRTVVRQVEGCMLSAGARDEIRYDVDKIFAHRVTHTHTFLTAVM